MYRGFIAQEPAQRVREGEQFRRVHSVLGGLCGQLAFGYHLYSLTSRKTWFIRKAVNCGCGLHQLSCRNWINDRSGAAVYLSWYPPS